MMSSLSGFPEYTPCSGVPFAGAVTGMPSPGKIAASRTAGAANHEV